MKIAVLMGSPRKGDSERICRLIEQQILNKAENVEFEYIRSSQMNITPCKGCGLCFQKGEEYCPIEDDITTVRKKMNEADGIIFASPVYACQITGNLKLLIDRLSFLFHRPELIGKKSLIVTTTDGGGTKATQRYLKMVAAGWGCNVASEIPVVSSWYFPDRPFNNYYHQSYAQKTEKKIKKIANLFHNRLTEKELKRPSLYELFMFNCLRSKTYTSSVDYRFWEKHGWMEQDYFYPVRLGPLKLIFSRVLGTLVKIMARRIISTQNKTMQSAETY